VAAGEPIRRLVGQKGGAVRTLSILLAAPTRRTHDERTERLPLRRGIQRGGDHVRVELDDAHVAAWPDPDELLAVDEAIRRLEEEDRRAADVVRFRYFAGLDVAETAQALSVSERTVMREWAYAKAWLRDALGDTGA